MQNQPRSYSGATGGLRQPAPGRRFTVPQTSCDPAPVAMKTGDDSGDDVVKMRGCRRDATAWR
ncbi:hypothetical protein EHW64_20520 [Erwinia psidii]|uniref:hypothetical protein n=1 Tax=Erwinia psidii TaxID=69224 RepID=UPI00226B68E6|nr:hypothetical protein [Erwinia psidii]MCX8959590.1 hypothetical protein [Erwinia psidii]MCX8963422.1 hypothetical protein [Erwinia psidii]